MDRMRSSQPFARLVALCVAPLLVGCAGRTLAGFDDAGTDARLDAPVDSAAFGACDRPSACVVRPASCCGSCGAATRSDLVAVASARAADYANATCGLGWGCPACYLAQDPTLLATCGGGACAAIDWATHPANACAKDADCRVRTRSCCECPGPVGREELLAVPTGATGDFMALVCDADAACGKCMPQYPKDALAVCEAGHCKASWYVR